MLFSLKLQNLLMTLSKDLVYMHLICCISLKNSDKYTSSTTRLKPQSGPCWVKTATQIQEVGRASHSFLIPPPLPAIFPYSMVIAFEVPCVQRTGGFDMEGDRERDQKVRQAKQICYICDTWVSPERPDFPFQLELASSPKRKQCIIGNMKDQGMILYLFGLMLLLCISQSLMLTMMT